MGLIGRLLGSPRAVGALGEAVARTAEVFTPNATQDMVLAERARAAALGQFAAEFAQPPGGWFDRLVDGLNRLPRPALAFGTLGLFAYAMVAPEQFARRMAGLQLVPEPLWWLLGAIVGFYFGAREMHYLRGRAGAGRAPSQPSPPPANRDVNPAIAEWRRNRNPR